MRIESVGIIGTGVIGASWAAFYASKGLEVKMYDVDAAFCRKGVERTSGFIEGLRAWGLLSDEAGKETLLRIRSAEHLEEAVGDAQLVQESVSEDYDVKHQVFKAIDAGARPDTVIASSSSGLLMSEIQKVARYPGRCLIAHPFNPPHLIPLVELVPGEQTDHRILGEMKAFYEGLGKIPVVLKREAPGHIANRLAAALWREAIEIVMQGIATVEDVDKALSAGPGLRWAIMGQHLIYHLGGGEGGIEHFIDHLGPAFEMWWESMATWTTLPPGTKDILAEGVREEIKGRSLAETARWRDEKLIGILRELQL